MIAVGSNAFLFEWKREVCFLLSFFIVAFGQPAWNPYIGALSAIIGFAIFWYGLLGVFNPKLRFCIGVGWYASVQIVQLSWLVSHPYSYIYAVLFFCAWLMGIQWGLLSLWIRPSTFLKMRFLFALAGLWTLLEWSRLFILSGLPFNPVGLSLSGFSYPLQFASIGGVYGLSFWVILTNLLVVRAWLFRKTIANWMFVLVIIFIPYGFGLGHFFFHTKQMKGAATEDLRVVLVQTAFPVEENRRFSTPYEVRQFVLNKWKQILRSLKKQVGQSIDFIILPEYVVPFGTYSSVFPLEEIKDLFLISLGVNLEKITTLKNPFVEKVEESEMPYWVSNAFIIHTLTQIFQSDVVIGLEDHELGEDGKMKMYSAGLYFKKDNFYPERYEKQILVPMGEYIPFEWCRQLAARYGISGSFNCGEKAKVFLGRVPFGLSICYEEIYGDLMRQNRQFGAELLINLTNDGWYPFSTLPKQHFYHARLRTVENGIPLLRACNTGMTGAVDSLGRTIGLLSDGSVESQALADSFYVQIPSYHYRTLYSNWGDRTILTIACFCLFVPFLRFLNPK